MIAVSTIGLDIAKNVFQIHGVDQSGDVVFRKRMRRNKVLDFFRQLTPCLVGIEACGTSHYWGRELTKLGHNVKLMPTKYVKPFVKRGKNDAADAEAICEAVIRPNMRFVPVKSEETQSLLLIHHSRDLLVRQRTMLCNALRSHMSEFGIIVPQGIAKVQLLIQIIEDKTDNRISAIARECLMVLVEQFKELQSRIKELEHVIQNWHKINKESQRLATIPGIGPMTATALISYVSDASVFKSGRDLAAWIGLVPLQNSSGGKTRLGSISKQGNRYLRRLFFTGALAVIRQAQIEGHDKMPKLTRWVKKLLEKKPKRVVAVALANKMARIAWVLLVKGEHFQNRGLVVV